MRNRTKYRWPCNALAVLIAIVGASLGAAPAHADWLYKLVRITCVPGASFAAVETFSLYNIGESPELEKQGIHYVADIKDQPVECVLPQGKVSIEVVGYHEPQAQGMCGGVEDAGLKVSLDGTEVAMADKTHGGCTSVFQHEIQISQYSVLHCVLEFERPPEIIESGEFKPFSTQCKSLKIWP